MPNPTTPSLRSRAFVCPAPTLARFCALQRLLTRLVLTFALLLPSLSHIAQAGELPRLKFSNDDLYYMPRQGRMSPIINSMNYDALTIKVHRLFPNNLPIILNMGDTSYDWEEHGYSDLPRTEQFQELSEEVTSFTLPVAMRNDAWVSTTLPLAEHMKNLRGVFLLEAFNRQVNSWSNYITRRRIVLLTDLGVLTHWTADGALVYVHDLTTLKPHDNARVTLYSNKNQVLASGKTDRQGLVQFGPWPLALGGPSVLVAEHGNEYTFLKLNGRDEDQRELPDAVQEPYRPDKYQAFVHADRGLYRPGEPVHLRWLVRSQVGEAVPAVPLQLRVLKPNGKPLLSRQVALSDLGTGGLDLATERAFPTGRYEVQLGVPGAEEPIGSYSFSLEDFVPLQLKAEMQTTSTVWTVGTAQQTTVTAAHLFGAPAADMQVESWLSPERAPVTIPGCEGYTFDNDSEWSPNRIELGEQKTDAAGTAHFTVSPTLPAEATMPLRATLAASVYDVSGRPVTVSKSGLLFPAGASLGLKAQPGTGGRGVRVQVAAVTPQGAPAALRSVKVALERREWGNAVRRYSNHYESEWSYHYDLVDTRTLLLDADARGQVDFTPNKWGYYRVRVYSAETKQYSTREFWSYGSSCEIAEPGRPTLIRLTLDKPSYRAGEVARLRIESPYDGRALVAVQGSALYAGYSVEIRNRVGELKFKVDRDWLPNCWLEVTAIHAVSAENVALNPFSSFAATPLRLEQPERKINVDLGTLPVEWQPGENVALDLTLRDERGKPVEGEVTLAAVDEGIHLITGYDNPDPLTWLARLRRPDLHRSHYYDKVSYDFIAPETGGDGDGMDSRLSAPGESWIKPVALWSGPLRSDRKGHLRVQLQLPEFTGQLRLVAVAASRQGMGAASGKIFVRRPWLLRAGVPRFGLAGDAFGSRAVFYNQSTDTVQVRLWAEADGAATVAAGELRRSIAAGGQVESMTTVTLPHRVGQAELRWLAEVQPAAGAAPVLLREALPLPVRAPAAWQAQPSFNVLKPGENKTYSLEAMAAEPPGVLRLSASAQPLRRLQQALAYTINYPYGCVEQTTSKLLPLYLLRRETGLLGAIDCEGKPVTPAALDTMIRGGIDRLFTMQAPDGGLGWWPGATESYFYGSLYALHCLELIEQGGEYPLPSENYEALKAYVRRGVLDAGQGPPDPWTQELRAYGLFVLVLGGDTRAAIEMERLDKVPLPKHSRLLLAAALARATHDLPRVKAYLKEAPVVGERAGNASEPEQGSWARNRALELLALGTANPDDPARHELARTLCDWLDQHYYGTTHESALIITALLDYLRATAASAGGDMQAARFSVRLPDGSTTQGTALADLTLRADGPTARFSITNDGASPVFVNASAQGVPLKGEQAEATSTLMSLRRRLYNTDGTLVTSGTVRQMGTYVVDLEVQLRAPRNYVVLTDLLPAGFEVVNPRLDMSSPAGSRFLSPVSPSYTELRDDRVIAVFNELAAGTLHYYYTVQAVTPGRFAYPAAAAEAMYDLAVRANTASGALQVVRGQ